MSQSCDTQISGNGYPYTVKFTPHTFRIERVRGSVVYRISDHHNTRAVILIRWKMGNLRHSAGVGGLLFIVPLCVYTCILLTPIVAVSVTCVQVLLTCKPRLEFLTTTTGAQLGNHRSALACEAGSSWLVGAIASVCWKCSHRSPPIQSLPAFRHDKQNARRRDPSLLVMDCIQSPCVNRWTLEKGLAPRAAHPG